MDKEKIIELIKKEAKGKEQLTLAKFLQKTGISRHKFYKDFYWRELCKEAGLKPYLPGIRIDDNDLFEEMRRVFVEKTKGIVSALKFDGKCQYSVDTYKDHFGKWPEVLLKFREWLEEKKIEFLYADKLPSSTRMDISKDRETSVSKKETQIQWKSIGGNVYGSVLNFRGLQHAPVNEQGVVFLFGMICSELSFVVEAIRTAYPDCEAKRLVNKSRDKWERVRIEFEYRSSSFKEHGHNSKDCDVIVCWEHDWHDCLLEVIELKSVIQKLKN